MVTSRIQDEKKLLTISTNTTNQQLQQQPLSLPFNTFNFGHSLLTTSNTTITITTIKMQYLTVATILSSALLASAAPTTVSEPLERRGCQVAYPESIGFPINYSISQGPGASNKVDNAHGFNTIPAGSYGCQLEVNFPAGYPITSSGNSQVYVFNTATGAQVGTVNFASSPVQATKYVINSFTCEASMNYRLSIGSTTDAGSVAFADTIDAGITMTYNC
jgi:hypothetical protein